MLHKDALPKSINNSMFFCIFALKNCRAKTCHVNKLNVYKHSLYGILIQE